MPTISSPPPGADGYQHIHQDDKYSGYSIKVVKGSEEDRKPVGSNSTRTYATVQSQVVVTDKDGRNWRLNFESEVDITTNESARQIFDQLKAMKSLARNMNSQEINDYFAQGAEFKVMNASEDWDKPAHLTLAWKKAGTSDDASFQRLCLKTKKIYTSNDPYAPHFTYNLDEKHLSTRGWMKLIDKETKKAKAEGPDNPTATQNLKASAKGVWRGTAQKAKGLVSNTLTSIPGLGKKIESWYPSLKGEPKRHEISAKMADEVFTNYRNREQQEPEGVEFVQDNPPVQQQGAPQNIVPQQGGGNGGEFENNE